MENTSYGEGDIMRQFKFRAWDKISNHIVEYSRYGKPGDFWFMVEEHKWPVMQFTGLHDKNGKEIFEGDIVKAIYSPSPASYLGSNPKPYEILMKVVFEFNGFIGENIKQINKTSPSKNWKYKKLTHIDISNIEVIGNIYENPELLTN